MRIKNLKKLKYNIKIFKNSKLNCILKRIAFFIIIISLIFQGNYKAASQKIELNFNKKGEFKIIQFTDLHEHPSKNEKTIKFMENTLDSEKPDLVVLTGDNIEGKHCMFREGVEKAISDIAKPMEDRKIPWAVLLGNHDSEFCKISRKSQMKIYMSYKYNLSQRFSTITTRAGDYNILIKDSKHKKPVFNVYMIDSGDYFLGGYGYIKPQQIAWYKKVSSNLKNDFGRKIPSLMFFHIPLHQHNKVWKSGKFVGVRNEKECPQKFDSGLFSALLQMGDVKGVFVGHDHTNTYVGNLQGINLGYGHCTGFGGYGKDGFPRGARVFVINENKPEEFETYEKME
ncbi:metallophosphoesterase family protein [Clostridium sp.]|jgi:3',5'-cyclic AMP phosphodiesterase CpdA|uniref:metallophosphoesterase family protein n=1 Tax=Clostridium sp. TaxID=1506 RepID=UPI002586A144|nr:metallophosphoesterase family protein [Clostridium sp.]MDF2505521.1 phosphohydrolase [Clostridium sp.]